MRVERKSKQSADNSLITILDDFVILGNFHHYSFNSEKNKELQRLGLMPHYVIKREDWEHGKDLMNIEGNIDILLTWLYNDGIHNFPIYICVTEEYLNAYKNELTPEPLDIKFDNPLITIQRDNLHLLLEPEYFQTQQELLVTNQPKQSLVLYLSSHTYRCKLYDNFIFFNPKTEKGQQNNNLFAPNLGCISYTENSQLTGIDINAVHHIVWKNIHSQYINRRFFVEINTESFGAFSVTKLLNNKEKINTQIKEKLNIDLIKFFTQEQETEMVFNIVFSAEITDEKFIDIIRNHTAEDKYGNYAYGIKKHSKKIISEFGLITKEDIKIT